MRRKAFTLTELMVVVAVIALLLAVVMPSMTSVLAMGRATICRNNLHNLAAAFVASAHARNPAGDAGTTSDDVARIYPEPMRWPGIPSDAVPEAAMYRCPDDMLKRSLADCLKKLEYRCPYGYYPMDTMEGYGPSGGSLWYLARRGLIRWAATRSICWRTTRARRPAGSLEC